MADTITVHGELNVRRAYELLGEILGDRYGVEVKVKSIRKKEDAEKRKDETA